MDGGFKKVGVYKVVLGSSSPAGNGSQMGETFHSVKPSQYGKAAAPLKRKTKGRAVELVFTTHKGVVFL